MAATPITDINYVSVNHDDNSFKQPRQKIWGLFIKGKDVAQTSQLWHLAFTSSSLDLVAKKTNLYLQNPPTLGTGQPSYTINDYIVCEIVPIDSVVNS